MPRRRRRNQLWRCRSQSEENEEPFMTVIKRLSILSLLLVGMSALAADPPIYSHKSKGAIRGADPVAYFDLAPGADAVLGSDAYTHEWMGATWKFANAENRDKFAADPEAYAPQYGGYCAFAVSHNFTKSVQPDVWEIVDGKLYLNFNRTAYRKWAKDKPAAIVRGDSNWPTVLEECESHGNCS